MDTTEEVLYSVLENNDLQELENHLDAGISPNHTFSCAKDSSYFGKSLLDVAVIQGSLDLVRLLVEKGCNVNQVVRTYRKDDKLTIKRLHYVQNQLGRMSLFRAICGGKEEIVRCLIEGGADVNAYDGRFCSALWHAVDSNHMGLVKAILSSPSCNVNTQDAFRLAPIHIAALQGNVDVLETLLRHGATVDQVQLQGATALSLACVQGQIRVAHVLLQHGADPNFTDCDGFVPLSLALHKANNPYLVTLLINSGATMPQASVHVYSEPTRRTLPQVLKSNPSLADSVFEALSSPSSLRINCALAIKNILRTKCNKKSIVHMFPKLPLPTSVINYLALQ